MNIMERAGSLANPRALPVEPRVQTHGDLEDIFGRCGDPNLRGRSLLFFPFFVSLFVPRLFEIRGIC